MATLLSVDRVHVWPTVLTRLLFYKFHTLFLVMGFIYSVDEIHLAIFPGFLTDHVLSFSVFHLFIVRTQCLVVLL